MYKKDIQNKKDIQKKKDIRIKKDMQAGNGSNMNACMKEEKT